MLTEKQFRNKITYLSYFLSVAVVSIHTFNVGDGSYQLESRTDPLSVFITYFEKFFYNLEGLCVPMFFVISGYLFFRNFALNDTLHKYKSRAKSLLVPYVLWCSFYYFFFVAVGKIPGLSNMVSNPEELSLSRYLYCLWNSSHTTLWFVKALMIYVLVSPLIYLVLKNYSKKVPTGFILLAALIVLESGVLPFKLPFNTLEHTMYYRFVFYLIGAYVGINHKDIPLKKTSATKIISTVAFIGVLIFILFTDPEDFYTGYNNKIKNMIACISFWYALDFLSFNKKPKWFFNISFFIYCSHILILEPMEKIVFRVFHGAPFAALLDYLFMPFIVVAILTAVAYVLRRFVPKFWSFINGARGI